MKKSEINLYIPYDRNNAHDTTPIRDWADDKLAIVP
jgi:hypothetical protein